MLLARNEFAGFTLIELIVVIVIIGILSAVAVPRFINQGGNAKQAALTSIAAALTAASADNYARRAAGDTTNTSVISNCTNIVNLLPSNALLVGSVTATVTSQALTSNVAANCTVSLAGGPSALFRGIGIL